MMSRAGVMTALCFVALLAPSSGRSSLAPSAGSAPVVQTKHRGMAFEHRWGRRATALGYGSDASAASLSRLKEIGVDWVAITPFGFQRTPHDTTIRWGGSRFSETDERLAAVTKQAQARDLHVMLKPHIWLRPPAWVGMVEPQSEPDWAAWFTAYRTFMLHYADLAAANDIEALCIGNELRGTTHREDEWRHLIAEIRARYDGILTYGAHAEEVWDVPFWDALDFIGVSAYFPLSERNSPTRAELEAAWVPLVSRLEQLAIRWQRPVLFTEIGYRSVDFAARYPWKFDETTPINLSMQADAYSAFFEVVWPQPWFGGAYWWKWQSSLADGGPRDDDYTPRAKPAEGILERHYTTLTISPESTLTRSPGVTTPTRFNGSAAATSSGG